MTNPLFGLNLEKMGGCLNTPTFDLNHFLNLDPPPIILTMSVDDDETLDPGPCTHHGGHLPGHPNYQNNILIPIMDRILPDCTEGWHLVALAYKKESKEEALQAEDDLKKNWVKKLCNNFKKTTGRTGQDIKDQVA